MCCCAKVFHKHYKVFLGITVLVWVFSRVYEHFGHGVRSQAMLCAFLYPLLMGVVPNVILPALKVMRRIAYAGLLRVGANLFCCGIATLTVGSLLFGVVEIYGTTYHLLKYYYYAGIALAVVGAASFLIGWVRENTKAGEENPSARRKDA